MSDLTREEREAVGCRCWQLDGQWHHVRGCMAETVATIKQAAYERGAAEVRARVRALCAKAMKGNSHRGTNGNHVSVTDLNKALDADPSPSADDEGVAR